MIGHGNIDIDRPELKLDRNRNSGRSMNIDTDTNTVADQFYHKYSLDSVINEKSVPENIVPCVYQISIRYK